MLFIVCKKGFYLLKSQGCSTELFKIVEIVILSEDNTFSEGSSNINEAMAELIASWDITPDVYDILFCN